MLGVASPFVFEGGAHELLPNLLDAPHARMVWRQQCPWLLRLACYLRKGRHSELKAPSSYANECMNEEHVIPATSKLNRHMNTGSSSSNGGIQQHRQA